MGDAVAPGRNSTWLKTMVSDVAFGMRRISQQRCHWDTAGPLDGKSCVSSVPLVQCTAWARVVGPARAATTTSARDSQRRDIGTGTS